MPPVATSQDIAKQSLQSFLDEFDIVLTPPESGGPQVSFNGALPPPDETKSEKINLSLIGAIPSLANAATSAEIFQCRGGGRQSVQVDLQRGHNYIDPDIGMTPTLNGQEIPLDMIMTNPFTRNIFRTKDGASVVLSAVYVDLVYRWSAFLGCSTLESDAREKVLSWSSTDLESAAAAAGLPMSICQTEEAWQSHPHGSHLAQLPWVPTERIHREGPVPATAAATQFLSRNPARPLSGLRVICVTHAIAGPSAGRTLAEHGASVLQIMFTHGFEHYFVYTYANLGTASSRLNLHRESDRQRLRTLVRDAHVWIDSYRPNSISKFGFSDQDIRDLNPSIIISRVRCYGITGPWSDKPGFDMQGSSSSGLMSLMGEGVGDGSPQWPPGMVINDYTTGYVGALAIQSIILKRLRGEVDPTDGWLVSPSLTGTAMGILKHFKTSRFSQPSDSHDTQALPPEILNVPTALGQLRTLAPLPKMSLTPLAYEFGVLHAMGADLPQFPGYLDNYDISELVPMRREELAHKVAIPMLTKLHQVAVTGLQWRAKRNGVAREAVNGNADSMVKWRL